MPEGLGEERRRLDVGREDERLAVPGGVVLVLLHDGAVAALVAAEAGQHVGRWLVERDEVRPILGGHAGLGVDVGLDVRWDGPRQQLLGDQLLHRNLVEDPPAEQTCELGTLLLRRARGGRGEPEQPV